MSQGNSPEPAKTSVTFGGYVNPETVREYNPDPDYCPDYMAFVAPKPLIEAADGPMPAQRNFDLIRARLPVDVRTLTLGFAIVFTFLLGVGTTLIFFGGNTVELTAVTKDGYTQSGQDIDTSFPVSLEKAVVASLTEEVTRSEASDILNLSAPKHFDPIAAVLDGLAPSRTVGKLTEAEKELAVKRASTIISINKLRMLREGVLAGVYSVTAETTGDRKRIVLKTINADMTSKSMANLLQKLAEEGEVKLPKSLATADGSYDADTQIFNFVQTSLANDGTAEGAEAAREMSRRAFAASTAQTKWVAGERVYVVKAGDSLAYISLQFYGRPSAYAKIFEANRKVLNSPDRIQVGQRLIIPS